MTALHELSAQALSAAYRARTLSPVEAARAALDRIAAWEPKINAMYAIDEPGALAEASESEARWRAGEPLSPLDGVPITIKDNIPVKGFATPLGLDVVETDHGERVGIEDRGARRQVFLQASGGCRADHHGVDVETLGELVLPLLAQVRWAQHRQVPRVVVTEPKDREREPVQ